MDGARLNLLKKIIKSVYPYLFALINLLQTFYKFRYNNSNLGISTCKMEKITTIIYFLRCKNFISAEFHLKVKLSIPFWNFSKNQDF